MRECSRSGCSRPAVATLTYVYAESTVVLGPLGPAHEPGSYDLCREHYGVMSAPRGWEVIRLPGVDDAPAITADDDLMALARAVREAGMLDDEVIPVDPDPDSVRVVAQRGHLSVIVDSSAQPEPRPRHAGHRGH
ncbi:MAG: DUF3499 domain-containing protein [Acidipropionibacterium jensenii]|nr:DUF3499 domain-containing protein [Acidipropionibacterium jensenii]